MGTTVRVPAVGAMREAGVVERPFVGSSGQ
jgi:hypothetical protein